MWFNQWHPYGYLLDKFGTRVVHDSGFSIGAIWSFLLLRSESIASLSKVVWGFFLFFFFFFFVKVKIRKEKIIIIIIIKSL